MKNIKNTLLFVLIAVMVAGLFGGCEDSAAKMEALSGTWTMTTQDTEEQAQILVEGIELYEEEIALVDLTSLEYVQIVEFDTEGNYRFAYDVDGLKECVREFYLGMFEDLYEGRATLSESYGVDMESMTEEEFQQFYAEIYGMENFDSLMNDFVEYAYDYEALAEDLEAGTYTIQGNSILCTITGETEAESMGYKISGNTLTLTYIDGEEVYTKVG